MSDSWHGSWPAWLHDSSLVCHEMHVMRPRQLHQETGGGNVGKNNSHLSCYLHTAKTGFIVRNINYCNHRSWTNGRIQAETMCVLRENIWWFYHLLWVIKHELKSVFLPGSLGQLKIILRAFSVWVNSVLNVLFGLINVMNQDISFYQFKRSFLKSFKSIKTKPWRRHQWFFAHKWHI